MTSILDNRVRADSPFFDESPHNDSLWTTSQRPRSAVSDLGYDRITSPAVPTEAQSRKPGAQLIGLAGRAGSGKDTLADLLLARFDGEKTAYAAPLKDAAAILFNLTPEQLHDRTLKEQVDPRWGLSPRVILQRLGSEGLRDLFTTEIFTRNMQHRLDEARGGGLLVVTDCRFPNELQQIRDNGGLVIHLVRKEAVAVAAHISEQRLTVQATDVLLSNDGSVQELVDQAVQALGRFRRQRAKNNTHEPASSVGR